MLMFLGISDKDAIQPLKDKCLEYNKKIDLNLDAFKLPSHISLKISFDIENNDYDLIKERVRGYFNTVKPFRVKFSKLELLDNIIWLLCEQNNELLKIHNDLDNLLMKEFNIKKHEFDDSFIFHSTLFVDEDREKLKQMFDLIKDEKINYELYVDTFLIGSSELGTNGSYKIDEVIKNN